MRKHKVFYIQFRKAYQIFAKDTDNPISQQMTSIIKLFERFVEQGRFQQQYNKLFSNSKK